MTAHEQGYRAALSGLWEVQYADHWSGKCPLDKDDDWFAGYEDALADRNAENPFMYEVD